MLLKWYNANSDSVTLLDKKIVDFISKNCLPFSIVEEKTFKNLLSMNDRTLLQGRRHYSDWVLPRYYEEMKNKARLKLSKIMYLSFTTDIWSKAGKTLRRRYDNVVYNNSVQDVPTRWNSSYDMCERLIEQKKAIERYLVSYNYRKLDLEEMEWEMVDLLVRILVVAKGASDQLCRDNSSTSMIIPVSWKLKAFMESVSHIKFKILQSKFMRTLKEKFNLEDSRWAIFRVYPAIYYMKVIFRIHVLATLLNMRFKDHYSANTS